MSDRSPLPEKLEVIVTELGRALLSVLHHDTGCVVTMYSKPSKTGYGYDEVMVQIERIRDDFGKEAILVKEMTDDGSR